MRLRSYPIRGIVLLCAVTLLASDARGQDSSKVFSRFRALVQSADTIDGVDGRLTANALHGQRVDGRSVNVPRAQVSKLEIVDGNQLWLGAGAGALLGVGITALAVGGAMADTTRQGSLDWNRAGMALTVLTGSGAVIGAIIGARSPRWRTVNLAVSATPSSRRLGLVLGSPPRP
jgi:hypothetical protein